MPEPWLDKRQKLMKYVDASSFEGDPIHCTANGGAPSRHGGSPSRYASDSDDSGKAVVVEGDTDVSGITGKELMNVASSSSSSSSSSSTVADTQDTFNNLASGSGSQYDEAEDKTDEDTTDEDTTDEDTTDEDTTDVPEALPMSMNESDAHLHWRNREPRLFEDTPAQSNISSGLGNHECVRLMELPEEPQHDADPHQVQEPEEMLVPSTSIVTFQVPGFSMSLAGGIVPFAEWQSVEDPDDVGLENLDIFHIDRP